MAEAKIRPFFWLNKKILLYWINNSPAVLSYDYEGAIERFTRLLLVNFPAYLL
jgi:hypothetical protein